MFPRQQRITTTKVILQVLRKGDRRIFGCVACHFISKPGSLEGVTVIVDTKVSKRAVVRNLLKRRIRALLRTHGLPKGLLVVRLLKGADQLEFQELEQQLLQCLKRLATTRPNGQR